jgi:hypothetical protein
MPKLQIHWSKVITNSVTILVSAVFVGAAAQLWNGVQTIDSRIDENLSSIRATQQVLAPKVDSIESALAEILNRLDKESLPPVDFKPDPKPTIEAIDDQTFHNQQIQQRHIPRR